MWEPERRVAQGFECPICGRRVNLEEARKCNGCRKVVCLNCFDVPSGCCSRCKEEFEPEKSCPDYIA